MIFKIIVLVSLFILNTNGDSSSSEESDEKELNRVSGVLMSQILNKHYSIHRNMFESFINMKKMLQSQLNKLENLESQISQKLVHYSDVSNAPADYSIDEANSSQISELRNLILQIQQQNQEQIEQNKLQIANMDLKMTKIQNEIILHLGELNNSNNILASTLTAKSDTSIALIASRLLELINSTSSLTSISTTSISTTTISTTSKTTTTSTSTSTTTSTTASTKTSTTTTTTTTAKSYLMNSSLRNMTLTGHTSYIRSLAVLPDGTLASGSADLTIKIWNTTSGSLIRTLTGHSSGIFTLVVLPDGKLASGSSDQTIKIWNITTGALVNTLSIFGAGAYALLVLPDGTLASGSSNIKIWNTTAGLLIKTIDLNEGSYASVNSLLLLPDGSLLSSLNAGNLKTWNITTGLSIKRYDIFNKSNCLALLSDGTVALGSYEKVIYIFDPNTGSIINTLYGHGKDIVWNINNVNAVVVLPDGSLASGAQDNNVILW